MDLEFLAQLTITLDELRTRVKMLEEAVTQIPQINFQVDPSRPAGVLVTPAALTEESA